jgi:membrane protease YdiL (CAAX protease family)
MSLTAKLLLALAVEIAYAVATRAWLPQVLAGIPLELAVTALRLATAVLYWRLFQALIFSRQSRPGVWRDPLLLAGLAAVLLSPVVAGAWELPDAATRWVFAATSLVVALREELLYRGVLQNLLERPCGWLGSVLVSNLVFVLYHYGAWPFTLPNLLEFFAVGCVVGLLYRASGSLWLAVALHAVYDALWCFTPLLDPPLGWGWGTGLQLVALLLVLAWAWRRLGPPVAASG